MIARYAVLVQYDFFNTIGVPSNVDIADPSLKLRSRGSIQVITLPAMPVDDFAAKMM